MVPQSRPPILITRPQPQAARLARQLRGLDWTGRVFVSPVLAPHLLDVAPPARRCRAVILTSETAALAARRLTGLPNLAFCVGDRTALVARRGGFQAISAKGDAEDLLALILRSKAPGPLLYLHGRETRGTLVRDLDSAGIETIPLLSYTQDPRPLGPRALALIRSPGPIILPIYSPRSAVVLASQWASAPGRASAHVIALSLAVAEAAAVLHPAGMTIAARPDGDSLLAAMQHRVEQAGWT